jgi:hypothetical protein
VTTELTADRDLSRDTLALSTLIRAFDVCDLVLSAAESSPSQYQTPASGYFDDHVELLSGPTSTPAVGQFAMQGGPAVHSPHPHGALKLYMMLKQLELNLTQARMCLSLLAASTSAQVTNGLANRSTVLQKRIHSVVGSVYG